MTEAFAPGVSVSSARRGSIWEARTVASMLTAGSAAPAVADGAVAPDDDSPGVAPDAVAVARAMAGPAIRTARYPLARFMSHVLPSVAGPWCVAPHCARPP